MIGITSYGAYVPSWRIKRETISGSGHGERSVGNFDEDTLTMAVSATIQSIAGRERKDIEGLLFASTTFPYKEKQNATIVAAASDLRKDIFTMDVGNSLRAGTCGLKTASDMVKSGSVRNAVVVASDTRMGVPGSVFEHSCGDGAAAICVGRDHVVAEIESSYSLYNEMVDVWRSDEDKYVRSWDERFVQSLGYNQTVYEAVSALMKRNHIEPKDIQKAAIYAPDQRRLEELTVRLGFNPKTQVQNPMIGAIGNTGSASPLMLLIAALEEAKAGDRLLCVGYGDGCDAIIFKVTEGIEKVKGKSGLRQSLLESKRYVKDYVTFLEWKGIVRRERGPGKPVQEVSLTSLRRDWREVIRFYGSKCKSCGTIQYPPQRVCTGCHAIDQFEEIRLSDKMGKIFTFSIDHISDPLDIPMILAVVDFDGGGRAVLTMTDHNAKETRVGMPVEMTFRKLFMNDGIHNYFWKCVPLRTK
ncbi:MAG: 3-hydroxy-3-methylglutaryl CoA synthase [Desulfobacteraceae bacterium]|nr:MAG: 3-hydroxy-3-methylglutaryl CoA synthase [Desulfobacteraceae bacterium]